MGSTGTHRQIRKARLERDNCRRLLAAAEKHGAATPTALQRVEYLHQAEAALWRARSDLCRHDPRAREIVFALRRAGGAPRWRSAALEERRAGLASALEERRAGLASARLRQARDPDAWGVDALLEVAWSHLAEQENRVQAYHAWFYRDRIGQKPADVPCYHHRDGSVLYPPCAHTAYGVDLFVVAVLAEVPVLAQGQCHLCGAQFLL